MNLQERLISRASVVYSERAQQIASSEIDKLFKIFVASACGVKNPSYSWDDGYEHEARSFNAWFCYLPIIKRMIEELIAETLTRTVCDKIASAAHAEFKKKHRTSTWEDLVDYQKSGLPWQLRDKLLDALKRPLVKAAEERGILDARQVFAEAEVLAVKKLKEKEAHAAAKEVPKTHHPVAKTRRRRPSTPTT